MENVVPVKNQFLEKGYDSLEVLISKDTIEELKIIYERLLADKQATAGLRSDLAGGEEGKPERIIQIMRPSLVAKELADNEVYAVALKCAKNLLGEDMELDFDMLINKAAHTDTETPWHQDAAYWIDMPDKRSVSCWIALDKVFEENGCMWFIPKKSDQNVFAHKNLPKGGALYCETDTSTSESIPLMPGGCTFHDGFTLHYSRGNITSGPRRALILNFRPAKMILLEREQGMDHTGGRKVRQK